MLNTAFGMSLKDNKSGFILCAREVFEDLLSYRGSYYYWQSFIMVAAHAKGYTYKQIETLFEHRRAGKSFLDNAPIKAVARSFVDIGKALFEYRLQPAVAVDAAHASSIASGRSCATRAQPLWRRLLLERLPGAVRRDPLDDDQGGRRASSRDLQRVAVAVAGEDARAAASTSCAGWCGTPTGTCRSIAIACARWASRPTTFASLDDLSKLPFLTKDDVRKHLYFDIMSDNHDKAEILKVTTSGSTGEPFVCFVDRAQLEFRWAATLRAMEWTGWRFGDRQLRLWHQTLGMSKTQVARELADALLVAPQVHPGVRDARRDAAPSSCAAIEEFQPVLLDGYAESFNFLAQYLQGARAASKLSAQGRSSPSAQTLPEGSRKIIEEAFGCKVFDKYGSREFSGIAYECEAHAGPSRRRRGLHRRGARTTASRLQPGEIGEVVITDLNNYCLPFIRYRIGDLAEAMDPSRALPCGRGLPRIGKIEGRVQSIIIGSQAASTCRAPSSRTCSRTTTTRSGSSRSCRPSAARSPSRWSRASATPTRRSTRCCAILHQFLGEDMGIAVEFVENIEMVRTGKRLATVCKLGIDFQQIKAS